MRTDPDAQAMQQAVEALQAAHDAFIGSGFTGGAKFIMAIATLRSRLAERGEAKPMFWVRLRSDGLYEGPIHDASIEEVRKKSGAWSPLFLAPPTHTAAVQAALERAAKLCETAEIPFSIDVWHTSTKKEMTARTAIWLATAIRALTPQDVLGGGQ